MSEDTPAYTTDEASARADEAIARLEEALETAGGAPLSPARIATWWEMTTLDQAAWALRRIAAIRAASTARHEFAQRQIETITDWEEREKQRSDRDEAFFLGHLEAYARRVNEENPRTKTISLPNGKLCLRQPPLKWCWPDDENEGELLTFARSHECTRTVVRAEGEGAVELADWGRQQEQDVTETVVRTGLKEILKPTPDGRVVDSSTGEVVPGVRVEREPLTFKVEVS